MVEKSLQNNNMTRRSYKAITNTSSDESSSHSRQLPFRATENKTFNICSLHTTPIQKIKGTSTYQHIVRSSAPIQQTSSLKIDSGKNTTSNDYVAQHAKTHPYTIQKQPLVEEKSTQANFTQKDMVTNENMLVKRAEICEFYEKQELLTVSQLDKI